MEKYFSYLGVQSLCVSVRTFNVLLGIKVTIETEEGFDDGGGGHLVNEAPEHLVGPGHEELAELESLHEVVLVTLSGHTDQVSQGAV